MAGGFLCSRWDIRALGCCSRNSRWDLHQGMCPQFLIVQTSASQALGMWERLEPSRDLRRDAGKTFGKLLCWLQLYPTPAMGAAANYFNGILGGIVLKTSSQILNPDPMWKRRATAGSCA